MKKAIILSAFILTFLCTAAPAEARPSVAVRVAPEQIDSHNTAVITLAFEWNKDEGSYTFAIPSLSSDQYQVVREGTSEEAFRRDGTWWTRKNFEFEVRPSMVGKVTVPAFPVTFVNPDAVGPGELTVPAIEFSVRKSSAKGVFRIVVSGLCLAGIVSLVLFVFIRKKYKAGLKSDAAISEDTVILQDIRRFMEGEAPGDYSKVPSFLMNKLFAFLVFRYKLKASASDREDLLNEMQRVELSREDRARLDAVITRLREAKYGGAAMNGESARDLAKDVEQFIKNKRILGGEPQAAADSF